MATFTSAIKTCLIEKPFTINARAPRSEYWFFWLFLFIANFLLVFIEIIPLIGLVVPLIQIFFFICSTTALIRRLHDINRSGWWVLLGYLPVFVSIILFVIGMVLAASHHENAGFVMVIVGAVISIAGAIILLIFSCTKGTPGVNRWGPNPLDMERFAAQNGYNNFNNPSMYSQGAGPAPQWNPNQGFGPTPNGQPNQGFGPAPYGQPNQGFGPTPSGQPNQGFGPHPHGQQDQAFNGNQNNNGNPPHGN